jgi:hypothetical protein
VRVSGDTGSPCPRSSSSSSLCRAERATRRDARIELPEAPRRRVAGVHEHLLAALARELVHPLEACDRHEHLAPRLEEWPGHTSQPLRHGADGAHVRRHVLAGNAITPGRRALEQASAIDHAHGEPIEFRLRDVIEIAVALEPLVDAPVEGTQVLLDEGIVERQHRHLVHHLAEGSARGAGDPLRG